MSRPLIIANWKIYPTLSDALVLAASYKKALEELKGVTVVVAPPTAWLAGVVEAWGPRGGHVSFAAQNVWPEDQGAFTGETSAYMVKNLVQYALAGHSERRRYAHEDDDLIREKIQACLRWKISPILCIGETKRLLDSQGRVDSYQWQKLTEQLMSAFRGVKDDDLGRVIVAYEPVWAVGTQNPARPEYAAEVIARLRERLVEKYGRGALEQLRFIYGGSVTAENAADYLRQEGINGLLPGSVSVRAKEFLQICRVAAGQK